METIYSFHGDEIVTMVTMIKQCIKLPQFSVGEDRRLVEASHLYGQVPYRVFQLEV